jgi:hypothetical protein
MIEIDQNLQASGDDFVRFSTLDIGHEPDAARVMLVAGVIKSLQSRGSRQYLPLSAL